MILRTLLEARNSAPGTSSISSPQPWLLDALGVIPTESGVPISERSAMGLSAVWTCVSIRTGLLASLPLHLYKTEPNGKRKLVPQRSEYRLLHDQPNAEDTSYNFVHKIQGNWLLWGNGYALLEYDGRGSIKNLWPYHPSQVTVEYGQRRGEFWYMIYGQNRDGAVRLKVMPEDMLHFRGFCHEGVEGLSVIQSHRRTLGLAVAREVFASSFYKNGARTSGIITYPGKLKPEAASNLLSSFEAKFAGSTNAGKTALFEEGAKYQPNSMPLNDAQFIESWRMSRAEVAGMFRMPTMLVPGSDDKAPTYASSETFNRQLVDYTLRDDTTLWQQELNRKIFPDGDYFFEFDLRDLLRGDNASRAEFFKKLWEIGVFNADEIRESEGEDPIPNGNGKKYYRPANWLPVDAPEVVLPKPKSVPEEVPATSAPGTTVVPAPSKGGPKQMSPAFRTLLGNLVKQVSAWENFNPKHAATMLRNLLIEPLVADMELTVDGELVARCAETMAAHVRTIGEDQLNSELELLAKQLGGNHE